MKQYQGSLNLHGMNVVEEIWMYIYILYLSLSHGNGKGSCIVECFWIEDKKQSITQSWQYQYFFPNWTNIQETSSSYRVPNTSMWLQSLETPLQVIHGWVCSLINVWYGVNTMEFRLHTPFYILMIYWMYVICKMKHTFFRYISKSFSWHKNRDLHLRSVIPAATFTNMD